MMEPALAMPYERLVQTLSTFAASIHAALPGGPPAPRWSRAATLLDRELQFLQSLGASTQTARAADHAELKSAAARLTQLARTLDGLRFEQSIAASAAQLQDEQRLVVFAAWQLQQAIEQVSDREPAGAAG